MGAPLVSGQTAAALVVPASAADPPHASSINRPIWRHVPSQDVSRRNASASLCRLAASSAIAAVHARTNPATSSAMRARRRSPYGLTTSRIDVETTGLPAARYSGVLVGLMNRVDSLRANGSSATSQPAT